MNWDLMGDAVRILKNIHFIFFKYWTLSFSSSSPHKWRSLSSAGFPASSFPFRVSVIHPFLISFEKLFKWKYQVCIFVSHWGGRKAGELYGVHEQTYPCIQIHLKGNIALLLQNNHLLKWN